MHCLSCLLCLAGVDTGIAIREYKRGCLSLSVLPAVLRSTSDTDSDPVQCEAGRFVLTA
jgi:hypothetical protein